ncbi:MAG: diacylglycerol kinase family protein [bacterium]
MQDIFIVVNPSAGRYSDRVLSDTKDFLKKNEIEPKIYFTKSEGDATLIASNICNKSSNPLIAIIGGDGTINEVINGISHHNVTLAVLPSGTANVLAKELAIPNYKETLGLILSGEKKELFLGEVQLLKEPVKKRFILMAGVGIDGEVVSGLNLGLKKIFGKYAYLFSAIRCLFSWDNNYLVVSDGAKAVNAHSVIACNASKYGGNFKLAHNTDVFKRGLQLICVHDDKRRSYIKLAIRLLFKKTIYDSEDLSFIMTDEAIIDGKKAIQVDGDFFGFSPAKIAVSPFKIGIIA